MSFSHRVDVSVEISDHRQADNVIIITGYVYVNPSDVTEFLTDIARLSAGTRAEEGCLFYVVPWTMRRTDACS